MSPGSVSGQQSNLSVLTHTGDVMVNFTRAGLGAPPPPLERILGVTDHKWKKSKTNNTSVYVLSSASHTGDSLNTDLQVEK